MNANGSGQLTVQLKSTDHAAAVLSRCERVTGAALAELHAKLGWLPELGPPGGLADFPDPTGEPTLVLAGCTWRSVVLADDDDRTPLDTWTLHHDPDPDDPGAYVAAAFLQAGHDPEARQPPAEGFVSFVVHGPDDRARWRGTVLLPTGWPW